MSTHLLRCFERETIPGLINAHFVFTCYVVALNEKAFPGLIIAHFVFTCYFVALNENAFPGLIIAKFYAILPVAMTEKHSWPD